MGGVIEALHSFKIASLMWRALLAFEWLIVAIQIVSGGR
jgi:hypothetical protein